MKRNAWTVRSVFLLFCGLSVLSLPACQVEISPHPILDEIVGGLDEQLGAGSEEEASRLSDPPSVPVAEDPTPPLAFTTYNLGLFSVNLQGAGSHVLRMEINLKVDAALEEAGIMDERKDELRHHIITMATDYAYEDLDGLDGKNRLADELLTRLNRLMGNDRIDAIYFAQFMVQ